jgi:hypothetical protein
MTTITTASQIITIHDEFLTGLVEALRAKPGSTGLELCAATGYDWHSVMGGIEALRDAEADVFAFAGLSGTEYTLSEGF